MQRQAATRLVRERRREEASRRGKSTEPQYVRCTRTFITYMSGHRSMCRHVCMQPIGGVRHSQRRSRSDLLSFVCTFDEAMNQFGDFDIRRCRSRLSFLQASFDESMASLPSAGERWRCSLLVRFWWHRTTAADSMCSGSRWSGCSFMDPFRDHPLPAASSPLHSNSSTLVCT